MNQFTNHQTSGDDCRVTCRNRTMTEREVFEAHAKMMGWDLCIGSDGKYVCEHTEAIWTGWKTRADFQRAEESLSELKHLEMVLRQIPSEFSSAQRFGEIMAGGFSVIKPEGM